MKNRMLTVTSKRGHVHGELATLASMDRPAAAAATTASNNPAIVRFEGSAVARALAYRQIDCDPTNGFTRCAMIAGPETINGVNVVLGGIQTAMLDMGLTAAALNAVPHGARVPTLEIKTSFLDAAPGGAYLCEAWPVRVGRTIGFFEARLKRADGIVVATASATVKIVVPEGKT